MKAIIGLFVFVVFGFMPQYLNAQYNNAGVELGINAGTLIYQGDLVPGFLGNYRTLRPAIGVTVGKAINPYFALRGSLLLSKISSDESSFAKPEWRRLRNFNFSTPVTEVAAHLLFTPGGPANADANRRITPYVFVGLGASFLNVQRNWRNIDTLVYGSKSDVQKGLGIDTLKSTPRVMPVFPIGAGVRYNFNDNWSVNAELNYRFTGADYLDGFKYAGNKNNKDAYYGLSIGLLYRFVSYKCPSVR